MYMYVNMHMAFDIHFISSPFCNIWFTKAESRHRRWFQSESFLFI